MERVVVGVAVPPPGMTAANADISAIVALGLDRDEGLRVEMLYGDAPNPTMDAVLSGRCHLASLNTIVGLVARERGGPVIATYAKAHRMHRWFAVPPGSAVRTLPDLRGRRVACDFDDLRPLAELALREEGVAAHEVAFVPWQGSGMATAGMLEPLRRGEVDAVFLIDWNDGDFTAEGLPMRRLPARALDRIGSSACLWGATAWVEAHPRAVAGIGRALAKATVFALENPEATVRLMWDAFPESRPRSAADEPHSMRRDLAILRARLQAFELDAAHPRWGEFRRDDMEVWADVLVKAGLVPRRPDATACYTAAHVDAYNEFDRDAIVARARALGATPGERRP